MLQRQMFSSVAVNTAAMVAAPALGGVLAVALLASHQGTGTSAAPFLALGATWVVVMAAVGAFIGHRFGRTRSRLAAELQSRSRAEQRFERVVGSAPFAILMVARDGRVVLSNSQAEHLFGHEAAQLRHMRIEELIPAGMREGHEQLRRQYGERPAVRAMGGNRELFCLDARGRQVPVEVGLAPVETDEGPMVLATLIDITERKASQQRLAEHAAELARSNRELDNFAYVASHDLKAPLRGITQLAGFIEEDAGEVLPESSRTDLALLNGRIRRMEALLDGLLQYSRIGRRESRPEWVDTRAVVESTLQLCVPAERFEVALPEVFHPVYAPRPAVELVFRNLLSNAVKHHDRKNGTIRIGCERDARFVHFRVADDGPGIPEAYAEKVFGLFQTLRPRDEVEGSGIGLALVRKSLEHHGGRIELRAGAGRGASFRVSWPRGAEPPGTMQDAPTREPDA